MAKNILITEKPSVAMEFAKVLNINTSRKDGYLEAENWIITWCVGHLVTMSYPEKYDEKLKFWRLDKGNEQDEEPAWFKSFREQQEARFAALEGEKVSNLRKAKLEALLKDTGTFGSRTLKSFSKMSFESDDDFEEFYSDVEEDLKNYNQERADAGLATLATPPAAGSKGSGKQDEVLTDKEVEDLVNTF